MDMGSGGGFMATLISGNGDIQKLKAMVFTLGKMEIDTRVNGTKITIREMVKGTRFGLTARSMRDIGKMIRPTAEVG